MPVQSGDTVHVHYTGTLADGTTKVENLLDSDDVRYMLQALDAMDVRVEKHTDTCVTVTGQNGPIALDEYKESRITCFVSIASTNCSKGYLMTKLKRNHTHKSIYIYSGYPSIT